MQTLVEIIDFLSLLEGIPGIRLNNRSQNEMFKKMRKLIEGMAKDFEPESIQTYMSSSWGCQKTRS
jgi:hypothetical protein